MSASAYKRATKKAPAIVDHTDGDTSKGFVLVPVGTDFVSTISQSSSFLAFELSDGTETYLNMSSIKRITEVLTAADKTQREKQAAEESAAKHRTEKQTAEKEEKKPESNPGQRKSPFHKNEEFEALDILGLGEYASMEEIQGTYRRLVKLYHPDRLRGLGVSDKKIAYAAERLAEINNAYKLLAKVMKNAA